MSNISIHASGKVTITINDKQIIKSNTIQPLAIELICLKIANAVGSSINKIKVMDGDVLVLTRLVDSITYQGEGVLRFSTNFLPTDFNSHLTKFILGNDLGDFAIVSGLDLTKDGTSNLNIDWDITLN